MKIYAHKTLTELRVIAKHFGLVNFRNDSKEDIIDKLLTLEFKPLTGNLEYYSTFIDEIGILNIIEEYVGSSKVENIININDFTYNNFYSEIKHELIKADFDISYIHYLRPIAINYSGDIFMKIIGMEEMLPTKITLDFFKFFHTLIIDYTGNLRTYKKISLFLNEIIFNFHGNKFKFVEKKLHDFPIWEWDKIINKQCLFTIKFITEELRKY